MRDEAGRSVAGLNCADGDGQGNSFRAEFVKYLALQEFEWAQQSLDFEKNFTNWVRARCRGAVSSMKSSCIDDFA